MSPSIVVKVVGHRSLDHILHYTKVKLAEEVLAGLRGWGARQLRTRRLDLKGRKAIYISKRKAS